MIVEKLEFINKQNSVVIKFGLLIYWFSVAKIENSPLRRQSQLQQKKNFTKSFPIFEKNKVWYFMRIVCQQTIIMKYHALFVILEKAARFESAVCCKV